MAILVPVIDLREGHAVHAIGGDRSRYGPLRSQLVEPPEAAEIPRILAQTYFRKLGGNDLYVADLDAITGKSRVDWATLQEISQELPDVQLWLDVGVRELSDLMNVLTFAKNGWALLALETIPGARWLADVCAQVGRDAQSRLMVSLDLRHQQPSLAPGAVWETPHNILGILDEVVQAGIGHVLVLDLASIGQLRGVTTTAFLKQARQSYPQLLISTGGGVRRQSDIDELDAFGIYGALIGTALHHGHLDLIRHPERPPGAAWGVGGFP